MRQLRKQHIMSTVLDTLIYFKALIQSFKYYLIYIILDMFQSKKAVSEEQVSASSAEPSTQSSRADQVRAKQQLVTEAGQRGCGDMQRLNRQPAGHALFFNSF